MQLCICSHINYTLLAPTAYSLCHVLNCSNNSRGCLQWDSNCYQTLQCPCPWSRYRVLGMWGAQVTCSFRPTSNLSCADWYESAHYKNHADSVKSYLDTPRYRPSSRLQRLPIKVQQTYHQAVEVLSCPLAGKMVCWNPEQKGGTANCIPRSVCRYSRSRGSLRLASISTSQGNPRRLAELSGKSESTALKLWPKLVRSIFTDALIIAGTLGSPIAEPTKGHSHA